jgi:hypothetical protein
MLSKYYSVVAFFSALFLSAVAAAPTPDVVPAVPIIARDISDAAVTGNGPRVYPKTQERKNEKQDAQPPRQPPNPARDRPSPKDKGTEPKKGRKTPSRCMQNRGG